MNNSIIRIDEPLKNGNCEKCDYCLQVKKTKYCTTIQNKNGQNIRCREIRVCNDYKH